MRQQLNNIISKNRKMRKEGLLFFLLAIGLIVACEGALEDGNPFGSSNSSIVINPSSPKVNKGGTLTFAAFGGTLPLSWSHSNVTIGTIDAGTGVFTSNPAAPQIAGISTVTVVDAVGDSDTATIQVLPNPLGVSPSVPSQTGAGTEIFTITGGSGIGLIASGSGQSSVTLTITTTATTVSVGFTAAASTETITITITDTLTGDVGTAILTLAP